MLQFVPIDQYASAKCHSVYLTRGTETAWVGTIKPATVGGAPQFFPRTPMGWDQPFTPTDAQKEQIEKFLLTLA